MFKLGVVGKNIAYSLSPMIHTEFGRALGIGIDYTLQDVGEGKLTERIKHLQDSGFYGCNITVPFKEDGWYLANTKSPRAQKAGSVNVFIFQKDGTIAADITDGVGLMRDIADRLQYSLAWKDILLCGAGGAARGILDALIEKEPRSITLANRELEKAELLAAHFSTRAVHIAPCQYQDLENKAFDVVIDATSALHLALPETLSLKPDSLVYDLKYSPGGDTGIMRWGKAKGAAHVHDGLGMLVEQAAEAFYIWTGKMPDTQPIFDELKISFYKTV